MSAGGSIDTAPVRVEREGHVLAGERAGNGQPIVLAHGLTASRRYVVHGSRSLPRAGFRTIAYDARGHGESDPAPPGSGYSYRELTEDLGALIESEARVRPVLAGHSMGAHTLTGYALANPDRVAGLVVIGPAFTGESADEPSITSWEALAHGLETGGIEGFIAAYDHGLDPDWRETLLRIARERLERHRHLEAVAQALREVPRSSPFAGLASLEALDVPALVVASRDEADPGHPYAVAAAWAERLPRAELISEEPGASPFAWQGGRLSRAIAAFCDTPAVAERRGA